MGHRHRRSKHGHNDFCRMQRVLVLIRHISRYGNIYSCESACCFGGVKNHDIAHSARVSRLASCHGQGVMASIFYEIEARKCDIRPAPHVMTSNQARAGARWPTTDVYFRAFTTGSLIIHASRPDGIIARYRHFISQGIDSAGKAILSRCQLSAWLVVISARASSRAAHDDFRRRESLRCV